MLSGRYWCSGDTDVQETVVLQVREVSRRQVALGDGIVQETVVL